MFIMFVRCGFCVVSRMLVLVCELVLVCSVVSLVVNRCQFVAIRRVCCLLCVLRLCLCLNDVCCISLLRIVVLR